jgi:protein TonB
MNAVSKISRCIPVVLISIFVSANVHAQTKESDSANNLVVEKVEVEASFPGGQQAWAKYITNAIMDKIKKFRRSDYGTCIVRFIVDTKGRVSDVQAMTMKKSRLAKVAIDAISNGPRWRPAQQDGKFVNAYRVQPVTLEPPKK